MAQKKSIEKKATSRTATPKKTVSKKTEKKDAESTCPYCGAKVAEGAKFCPNCGKAIGQRFCPNCGAKLQVGAKFCGECGGATDGGAEPEGSSMSCSGVNMVHGGIKAGSAVVSNNGTITGGNRAGDGTVLERIRKFIADTYNNTTGVIVGEKLTPEFLATAGLKPEDGETPILALKTWPDIQDKVNSFLHNKGPKALASFIENGKPGTMMITDRRLVYFRLRPNKFLASLYLKGTESGSVPLDEIREARIGGHDMCLGTTYVGHKFILNGKIVGLMRMGGGVFYDDETIEYLNNLFAECFNR